MKRIVCLLSLLWSLVGVCFGQPINIYQPNGTTTNFGKVAADSLNYYVVNYPALTLMKIDGNNNATLLTTLSADPFQTMIWNNGKGIFPVASGSPFKLFDGTNQIDISGGQLPMAGYTLGNVIILDYFHKGNTTYFRTNDKIYKTDYSSPSSILTLATKQSTTGVGIMDMSHTSNSIIFQNVVSFASGVLRRIDLNTGTVTTIDSQTTMSSFDKGIVYKDEYYYCTPYSLASLGNSSIFKVNDSGIKTIFYTESNPSKYIRKVIGATPNGIIAVIADNTGANEYVSIQSGVATALNQGTFSNSFPANDYSGGVSTKSLVYFTAYDTTRIVAVNKALWVTDGTLAGTKKIKGGPASIFNTSGLDQTLLGSSAFCENDIYYEGRDGAVSGNLIHVNGSNFEMNSYNYLPNTVTIRQTASGIVAVAKPSISLAAKAIFKVNCSTATALETVTNNKVEFDLFPNPSSGLVHIKMPNYVNDKCKLTVVNMIGDEVYAQQISKESSDISLNLKSGLYIFSIEQNGQKTNKKLLIN